MNYGNLKAHEHIKSQLEGEHIHQVIKEANLEFSRTRSNKNTVSNELPPWPGQTPEADPPTPSTQQQQQQPEQPIDDDKLLTDEQVKSQDDGGTKQPSHSRLSFSL